MDLILTLLLSLIAAIAAAAAALFASFFVFGYWLHLGDAGMLLTAVAGIAAGVVTFIFSFRRLSP